MNLSDMGNTEQMKVFFKMLEDIAPTDGIKQTIALVGEALAKGATTEQITLMFGLTAFHTLLGKLENIGVELRKLTVELELHREAMATVPAAIREYTVETYHSQR